MRVHYQQVPGRTVPFFAVWLIDDIKWLVGFVHCIDGRWISRRRGDTADCSFAPRWTNRTDAAQWLLLVGGFARQRPAPAPMQVAA